MPYTPTTTLYWRSLRRVERRAAAFRRDPVGPARLQLLAQACRTANRLCDLAYGPARLDSMLA